MWSQVFGQNDLCCASRKFLGMTDPTTEVVPQAVTEASDCFELPPPDPNAFTFTGTWEPHNWAWFFSGLTAAIATLMTTVLIYKHLSNFNNPGGIHGTLLV